MRALLLLLLSWPLAAQSTPNPAVSGQWIADEAAMLSESDHSRLRSLLQRIHRRTDAQIVVLTVPQVTGMGPTGYATKRFREWRLGSAQKNDGVLILLARQERAVEIITGTGLTKTLPGPALAEIIRARMLPALRDDKPADALANGIKDIAARLAGFDPEALTPVLPHAALALLGAALGIAATKLLWRFRRRPLALPPAGRAPADSFYNGDSYRADSFRNDKPEKFYRIQSNRIPGGSESYPAHLLWGTVLGMSLAAAGVAGLAVAALHPGLEPSFWLFAVILGLLCPLAVAAISPVNTGDFDGLPIVAALVAIIGGALSAAVSTQFLFSPYTLTLFIAPGAVFLFNLATGYFILRGFYGWTPEKFACESCGAPIRQLTPEETTAALPPWGPAAIKEKRAVFRGWRCAGKCTGEYLAHAATVASANCPSCHTPTRVESLIPGYRLFTCTLCNAVERFKLSGVSVDYSPTEAAPAAASNTDSYQDDQWRYRNDDSPRTPSGGDTSGDGAGANW